MKIDHHNTSWRELFTVALEAYGETWEPISIDGLDTESDLDVRIDATVFSHWGWKDVTLWTRTRIYLSDWDNQGFFVRSALRDPPSRYRE